MNYTGSCFVRQTSQKVFQKWKQACQTLQFCCLCALAAAVVYPNSLIFLTPFLIYRQIVKWIVLTFDTNCVGILSGWNSLMAYEDPYKPLAQICPFYVFNETIDRNHILKVFNDKVIAPNLYPNLRQTIVRKFGFYFWHKGKNLNLENHIKYLDETWPRKPVSMNKVRNLCVKFSKSSYDTNQSPWEMILIPNLVDSENPLAKSCIIFRTNHCLMDGLAVASLLANVSQKSWKLIGTDSIKGQKGIKLVSYLHDLTKLLTLVATGPYHAICSTCVAHDKNKFLQKGLALSEPGECTTLERQPVTMDVIRLRQIKDKHGVGMSSLLVTLAMESIMRFVKRRCHRGFSEVQDKVILNMAFPLPNHPQTMTNHWTFVRTPISVNKIDNPLATLKAINEEYEKLKTDISPLINFILAQIFGALPIWLFPKREMSPCHTVLLTNFPGPQETTDLFGYEFEDCSVLGTPVHHTGFYVACQSYAGKFWVDIGGVPGLVRNRDDAQQLQHNLWDVIKELEE